MPDNIPYIKVFVSSPGEDMSGNLREWCANNYDNPEIIDPADTDGRVLHGGSFSYGMYYASCESRYNSPYYVDYNFGVRLVVSSPILALDVTLR